MGAIGSIGGEEVSERFDYRPVRYPAVTHGATQIRLGGNKSLTLVVTSVGPQLAEKLQATLAMIDHGIVWKYAAH